MANDYELLAILCDQLLLTSEAVRLLTAEDGDAD